MFNLEGAMGPLTPFWIKWTLVIVNYGVSKHYAGSMVSDRCPLGYLFKSSQIVCQTFCYISADGSNRQREGEAFGKGN